MYNTILIPTDGSEGSERAVDRAIDLAKQYGAAIHVLNVVSPSDLTAGTDAGAVHDQVIESLQESGQELVDRTADRIAEHGINSVEREVLIGNPPQAICDYVSEEDVDLVVIGTHGRSGLERFLIGSVTEKVVRIAPIPVLTVPLSDDEA